MTVTSFKKLVLKNCLICVGPWVFLTLLDTITGDASDLDCTTTTSH